MSTIKATNIQLGNNVDATQNFVWQTLNDGTAKLARGNVGATTQDVLTVDAAGKVAFLDVEIPLEGGLPSFACRAWVNFDAGRNAAGGTDAANTNRFIRASGNVASVLKNGTGDFTITFTTPMPDANYCSTVTAGINTSGNYNGISSGIKLAGSYRFGTGYVTTVNVAQDCTEVSAAFFR